MRIVGCAVPKKEAFQPSRGVPAALGELGLGGSVAVREDMTADVHIERLHLGSAAENPGTMVTWASGVSF